MAKTAKSKTLEIMISPSPMTKCTIIVDPNLLYMGTVH